MCGQQQDFQHSTPGRLATITNYTHHVPPITRLPWNHQDWEQWKHTHLCIIMHHNKWMHAKTVTALDRWLSRTCGNTMHSQFSSVEHHSNTDSPQLTQHQRSRTSSISWILHQSKLGIHVVKYNIMDFNWLIQGSPVEIPTPTQWNLITRNGNHPATRVFAQHCSSATSILLHFHFNMEKFGAHLKYVIILGLLYLL